MGAVEDRTRRAMSNAHAPDTGDWHIGRLSPAQTGDMAVYQLLERLEKRLSAVEHALGAVRATVIDLAAQIDRLSDQRTGGPGTERSGPEVERVRLDYGAGGQIAEGD